MSAFDQITSAISRVFGMLFSSDSDVMSQELKDILSNPKDKKIYFEAINKLRDNPDEEVTITLSNNETLTLVS